MTSYISDNFKMLCFMAHLSLMLEKMDNLKGLNVYERKIKMRGEAFLKELEDYDKRINQASKASRLADDVYEANLQYSIARDSLDAWCNVWEQMILKPLEQQNDIDTELRALFKKHDIKVLYENNTNTETTPTKA